MSTGRFLIRFAVAGGALVAILVLQALLDEAKHPPAPCAASRCASTT